jgi:hypothetical protein
LCSIGAIAVVWAGGASALSTDPNDCLNHGWLTLKTTHGEAFRSERSCVRYASGGGLLLSPRVRGSAFCNSAGTTWDMTVVAIDFNPETELTVTMFEVVSRNTGSHTIGPFLTDRDGVRAVTPEITPPPDGFVTVTVRDAMGVEVTTHLAAFCPPGEVFGG